MTDHKGNVVSNSLSEQSKKFKILIPVWGEVYIDRLVKFTLSSMLASGNLKALRDKCDSVEIVFITTKFSKCYINKQDILKQLNQYASISHCLIDDLLPINYYGVILTLGYERAIMQDSPETQVQTNYIFLNADFVMSNNLLSTIVDKMDDGFSAILSPSLRASAESVMHKLSPSITNDMILDLPPRDMVNLALQDLHPMVIASIIDGKLDTTIAHQFFVKPNANLLIGRFFILFMLCIKPERPMQHVSSYCDYSFIPELCPSSNYCVLSDSDEGFLLELAPQEQEAEHIIFEKQSIADVYQRMQSWVTKEQYDYSKQSIYFHTKDLSSHIPEEKILNDRLEKLYAHLDKVPRVSHINHPFWTSAINFLRVKSIFISRLDDKQNNNIETRTSIVPKLTKILYGASPYFNKLHYKYQDYSVCLNQLQQYKNKAVLCVSDSNIDSFNQFLGCTHTISSKEILMQNDLNSFDLIFITATHTDIESIANILLSKDMNFTGPVIMYINLLPMRPDEFKFMAILTKLLALEKIHLHYAEGKLRKNIFLNFSSKIYKHLNKRGNFIKIIAHGLGFIYGSLNVLLHNIYAANSKKVKGAINRRDVSSITISIQMGQAHGQ